jgi:hypothetical protein
MSSRTRTLAAMRTLGATLGLCVSALIVSACGGENSSGAFAVTNISPRASATSGDQPVQITGSGFRQDLGYTVYFGAKRSERVMIMDEHTMIAATPRMDAAGPVDVIVASDSGPAFKIVQGFRFEDMGGNVMEQVGNEATPGAQGQERF